MGDPDLRPRSAASGLGLHCLHMSNKKDTRLIWVNTSQQSRVNDHLQNVSPDLVPNCTLIVFLKDFYEKVNFEKSQQTTTIA